MTGKNMGAKRAGRAFFAGSVMSMRKPHTIPAETARMRLYLSVLPQSTFFISCFQENFCAIRVPFRQELRGDPLQVRPNAQSVGRRLKRRGHVPMREFPQSSPGWFWTAGLYSEN